MPIRDRNARSNLVVLGVVVIVVVAGYRVFYGWNQVEDPENWRLWSVMAVLACLAVSYGWLGFSLSGSIAAIIAMEVVTTIDAATAPDLGGDGIWWPIVWIYAALTTAVVVVPASALGNWLWRRLRRRSA